jgi:hypothetical protein
MSDNINPEALADEELDAVAGGGCCDNEPGAKASDYIACPKGYEGFTAYSDSCSGCPHIGSIFGYNLKIEKYMHFCNRPLTPEAQRRSDMHS